MSGIQTDISITADPPGARNFLASADDGSVALTARLLTRKAASQVFTKTALGNCQSPASVLSRPKSNRKHRCTYQCAIKRFLNEFSAETTNGFVNFNLSLPKIQGHVLRPMEVFEFEIALNARPAFEVGESSNPDAAHAKRLLDGFTEM